MGSTCYKTHLVVSGLRLLCHSESACNGPNIWTTQVHGHRRVNESPLSICGEIQSWNRHFRTKLSYSPGAERRAGTILLGEKKLYNGQEFHYCIFHFMLAFLYLPEQTEPD